MGHYRAIKTLPTHPSHQCGFRIGVEFDIHTSTSFRPFELTVMMSPACIPLVMTAKFHEFDG